jgi:hypothetical protein
MRARTSIGETGTGRCFLLYIDLVESQLWPDPVLASISTILA